MAFIDSMSVASLADWVLFFPFWIEIHHVHLTNRVRAYGPGVDPTGPVVGAPANFTVETFSAGKGNVEVFVEDPRGQKIPVRTNFLLLKFEMIDLNGLTSCNRRKSSSTTIAICRTPALTSHKLKAFTVSSWVHLHDRNMNDEFTQSFSLG